MDAVPSTLPHANKQRPLCIGFVRALLELEQTEVTVHCVTLGMQMMRAWMLELYVEVLRFAWSGTMASLCNVSQKRFCSTQT